MSAQPQPEMPRGVAFERQYVVAEVAKLWGRSERFVRSQFRNHPGVVKIVSDGTLKKQKYTTLLIPASVVEEWHRTHRAG